MNTFMNLIILGMVSAAVIDPGTMNSELTAPYEGCLRPLNADRTLFNEVTKNLTFAFVGIITGAPPTPTTPGEITLVSPPIDNVLAIYEDTRGDSREIYITLNIENAAPTVIDENTTYALQISGIPVAQFEKYVKLFSIWLVRNDIDPAYVVVTWSLGSLYIAFYLGVNGPYDFAGQMIIIGFNAIATSATYVNDPGSTVDPIVAPTILVTITSEIFTSNTQTFIGTLLPSFFDTILDNTPFNRFVPYWGFPDPRMIALTNLNETICECSYTTSVSCSNFNAMSRISAVFTSRCCIMKRRCRSNKECCKSDLLKYFALVSSSLRCLPKLECCPKCVCELDSACRSSEDSVSVFAVLLLKICVNMKIDAFYYIQTLFDSVVGYNPFCSPTVSLYRLSSKDTALLTGSSVEIVEEEEHSECSLKEEPRGRIPKSRGSVASRYKWHIITVIVITIVASAYALVI